MISSKEIADYVEGRTRLPGREQFTVTEARLIGEALGTGGDTFDVEQFAMGLNVELEHGRKGSGTDVTHDDPMLTGKIVLAHLVRIPDYYTRLAAMVREADEVHIVLQKEDA